MLTPYLTVERDVVFILLKQYFGKQAGISDALVNRHQRHGGNLHSFLSPGGSCVLSMSAYLGRMIFLT